MYVDHTDIIISLNTVHDDGSSSASVHLFLLDTENNVFNTRLRLVFFFPRRIEKKTL